ncbi:unnamed protein product (macronuclear) [Paramecium tetraurelia]|uniref:Uncharacterized protein n=1 Tax=Paramecium tetraurelia TaxID=5888 RepID=A0CXS9_PARTE|nr:uncharacterized protein GSPATT00011228001 [Paramecium tetraurelia]CAK75596.1 unnamed protein product [Paramecium tetraurelia]|eukprot:XP_001442993.1 hypothetical protein (macronuclear) [Paramecium tetraurelia strain d4-2]
MEVKYRPPLNDVNECNWLEKNFVSCLKEKSVKDDLPKRVCKVENVRINDIKIKILWFFLECPERSGPYEDANQLRNIYIKQKLADLNPTVPEPRKRK